MKHAYLRCVWSCGQVNLKRKHWDPNASQGRSSKRCTQIFEQQMANAKQQGGSHKNVLPAAAVQRSEQQGGKAKGKKALKPWQLKKEKLSQKATQVHSCPFLSFTLPEIAGNSGYSLSSSLSVPGERYASKCGVAVIKRDDAIVTLHELI